MAFPKIPLPNGKTLTGHAPAAPPGPDATRLQRLVSHLPLKVRDTKPAEGSHRPRAALPAQPDTSPAAAARADFERWSRAQPEPGRREAAKERVAQALHRIPKPGPAPLVYVNDFPSHSGPVIHERYTPSLRELSTGQVLLDAQGEEGSRWMFYKQSPLATTRPGQVPEGSLVAATGDPLAPRLLEESFQPTKEQLASGRYWLDSHQGVHRWYRLEEQDALVAASKGRAPG